MDLLWSTSVLGWSIRGGGGGEGRRGEGERGGGKEGEEERWRESSPQLAVGVYVLPSLIN